jgi:hypothetical protein
MTRDTSHGLARTGPEQQSSSKQQSQVAHELVRHLPFLFAATAAALAFYDEARLERAGVPP